MTALRNSCNVAQRVGYRLSPCGATRPFRAWLIGIALLWIVLWVVFAVIHDTVGKSIAFSLFGVACADTVLYGMRSYLERRRRARSFPSHAVTPRRHGRRATPPGVVMSSAAGTGLLGLISLIPLMPLLGLLLVGSTVDRAPGGFLILLFAGIIWGVIALGGLVLQMLLISLGRLLAAGLVYERGRASQSE